MEFTSVYVYSSKFYIILKFPRLVNNRQLQNKQLCIPKYIYVYTVKLCMFKHKRPVQYSRKDRAN